jgi:hypothetical protein
MMPRLFLITAATAVVAGCAGRDADLGMSDSTYVNAMSDLKAVADDPKLSEPLRRQRRDAIFRKYALGAEQFEKASDALSGKPEHAMRLWRAIDSRAMKLGRDGKP